MTCLDWTKNVATDSIYNISRKVSWNWPKMWLKIRQKMTRIMSKIGLSWLDQRCDDSQYIILVGKCLKMWLQKRCCIRKTSLGFWQHCTGGIGLSMLVNMTFTDPHGLVKGAAFPLYVSKSTDFNYLQDFIGLLLSLSLENSCCSQDFILSAC